MTTARSRGRKRTPSPKAATNSRASKIIKLTKPKPSKQAGAISKKTSKSPKATSAIKKKKTVKSSFKAGAFGKKKITKSTSPGDTSSLSIPNEQDVNGDKENDLRTGGQPSDDHHAFYFFPKLPLEIRLKIWGLMAPKPRTLAQIKPLDYKPRHTYFQACPAPVVMHVCRESRIEFLYREDEAANSAEAAQRKGHALYASLFPNEEGKMTFFSFETDALHLMSFKVAEPLVRSSLRTIVIGPSPSLSGIFNAVHSIFIRNVINASTPRSWYIHPPPENDSLFHNPLPPVNNHTLLINQKVYPNQRGRVLWLAIKYYRHIKYDFRELVKFTALEKLVVMIHAGEAIPANPKVHIVWKTLDVVKKMYPDFKIPEVEFRLVE